ncbi:PLC-like phosphodiesterase [Amylostereum chailletii]|nr:PLC-like phosphodiesterase [Amylostereum chailletii]
MSTDLASVDVTNPVHVHSAPTPPLTSTTDATAPAPAPVNPAHATRGEPVAQEATANDIAVPQLLQQGTPMIKVSSKKQKRVVFRLDPDQGQILWDSSKHRIIPIENIKELPSGADARYYREQFQLAREYEARWLTIIYTLEGTYKTLHVVAPSADVFQMWDGTLRRLYAVRQALMSGLGHVEMREAVWEKQYWKGAEEGDQRLYFDDVERLCKRLNINPSREDLLRRFQQADARARGFLDFADFQRFVKLLKTRPELDRLYKKLCAGTGGAFGFGAFEAFMREHQKSTASLAELQRLFLRYASCPTEDEPKDAHRATQLPLDLVLNEKQGPQPTADASPSASPPHPAPPRADATMSLEAFTSFLLSPDNSAFGEPQGRVTQDMTRPLSEYYISSSHNTYLVGNQLVGDSTIEGYIRALLHSCRSVELDIYDGETEPVIYHGKMLTSKVLLHDICHTYAFVVSPYPIIISAEVHCGVAQQAMMVAIMRDVFGDALVSAPVEGRPKISVLPSPEALKGRVLLKAKNLFVTESEGSQQKEVVVDAGAESSTTTETSSTDGEMITGTLRWPASSRPRAHPRASAELREEFSKARQLLTRRRSARAHPRRPSASSQTAPAPTAKPRQKTRMSLDLVCLLVYTVGVKCRGLNKKEHYAPEHVFSLSETTANKMYKQDGTMADLIKHTRTHVVRIYPRGTRLSSTNYEPHRYWSAGAQLVAINWQTCDLGYMINHAMFQRNGRSGYVLKPLALRSADKDLLHRHTKHYLDVTVISAQQLPRPKDGHGREVLDKAIMDPFVEVSVHVPDWTSGAPPSPQASDPASGSGSLLSASPPKPAPAPAPMPTVPSRTVAYRTSVVKNNGFNPVWEEALSLPFEVVGGMRELVFVRFAVREEGREEDEPLAVYCVSLGSLLEGYRHLPLHDSQLSQYLFSTLFVQVGIRDA